jgi:hypothetical protein
VVVVVRKTGKMQDNVQTEEHHEAVHVIHLKILTSVNNHTLMTVFKAPTLEVGQYMGFAASLRT